jgi:hypothetical protein
MPVEYGQRRGMGWRYQQDPAQQDWQAELDMQYRGLPAQRALAENARQFNVSQAQQKKQFKTTNTLNETRFQQQRKDADKAGILSGLGSLAGIVGAYAGTREGGIGSMLPSWMGGNNQTGSRQQYAPWGVKRPIDNQQSMDSRNSVAFDPNKSWEYKPDPNALQNSLNNNLNSWEDNQQPSYYQYSGNNNNSGGDWFNKNWNDSYGGNLDRYLNTFNRDTFNPAGVGYA